MEVDKPADGGWTTGAAGAAPEAMIEGGVCLLRRMLHRLLKLPDEPTARPASDGVASKSMGLFGVVSGREPPPSVNAATLTPRALRSGVRKRKSAPSMKQKRRKTKGLAVRGINVVLLCDFVSLSLAARASAFGSCCWQVTKAHGAH